MHFSPAVRRWLPLFTTCFILLFTLLILLPLKNPPSLDDGLRHVTIGRLMAEHGIASVTGGRDRRDSVKGWGDFFFAGYFAHHNSDPWFLSDVLSMPLSSLPLVTALKVSILCSLILLLLSSWLFFRSIRLPPVTTSFLLLLLAWGEMPFYARLFLGRPFPLMTVLAILTVTAVLHRKWVFLPPLLCIATLLSHLFVLPLGISVIGALWLWTLKEKSCAAKVMTAAVLGVLAGLLLHPAPLQYLHYLLTVFIRIPFLFGRRADMGSEMYSAFSVGPTAAIPVTGIIILMAFFIWNKLKVPLKTFHREGFSFIAFLTLLFFCAFFVWMRALDVLWPLLVLSIALLIRIAPEMPHRFLTFFFNPPIRRISTIAPLIVLLFFSVYLQRTGAYFLRTNHFNALSRLQGLSLIPSGSRVLNLDWGMFALLFAVRPDLLYATGIDSNFTYLQDPAGSDLLLFPDNLALDPKKTIDIPVWLPQLLAHFPARYIVFPTSGKEKLVFLLRKSPLVQEVSADTTLTIFKVR